MCQYKIRVRGVLVLGRQLYLTDVGCRLGRTGPLVSYPELLGQLSNDKADEVARNVQNIRDRIAKGDIDTSRYPDRGRPQPQGDTLPLALTQASRPVGLLTADEPSLVALPDQRDPDEARLEAEGEWEREQAAADKADADEAGPDGDWQ